MKNIVFILVCFLMVGNTFGQNMNKSEISDTLVWFGLDFSHAKLVGTSIDFSDVHKITSYYFERMNEVMVTENEKYDFKKAYHVQNVEYNIKPAIERSRQNNSPDILTLKNPQPLTKANVKAIIKDCSFNSSSKTGLIYIVESLNKLEKKATVLVVFFDIKTKKILFSERMSGAPSGFGFRNYWLGAFYHVLKKSSKSYKEWAKAKG